MRKNILYCFTKHSDAHEAFYKATCGGKKRLNCLRIDSPREAHFFRVVKTIEQARALAGIVFSEVHYSGGESPEVVQYLRSLTRTLQPA